MHTTKKIAVFLLAVGVMLCDVGCKKSGPAFLKDLVPATGRVTVDGKPLGGATVMFTPAGSAGGARFATAVTDQNGVYELATLTPGVSPNDCKGAVPGDYVVAISRIAMPDGAALPEGIVDDRDALAKGAKQFVPAAYTDPGTSTLKAKVAGPKAENNFDLK